ncbi:troponin C-like [Tigriopus californicus]|uniref:troponin C-like n=1 Tax=Tigriopus californicus TaxID=6832 RepID=UPI0027DA8D26|nr:troponin C-like [Tigriopus californicus]|eukprot:TCALIF_09907-PA protein Name:"Similar to Troponin C, isoform 1 (Balanus nubilus)" AED:0.21 eAED:0.21 QI:281/1/1/1/1/1/6/250/159
MATGLSEEKMKDIGLEPDQVEVLMKCFNGFCKEGVVKAETVAEILQMMGLRVKQSSLKEIIDEVDEDGSGELEFEEFCILAARFLIEEDEEQMRRELKEAFRFYDKEGVGYLTIETLKGILLELEPKLEDAQLMEIVDEVDEDGSGTIDFDEFMNMMMG